MADYEDWTAAREAVQLITERGFHRGRDLLSAWDALRVARGHTAS